MAASEERGEGFRIEKQKIRELQPLTAAEEQQAITMLQAYWSPRLRAWC